MRWGALSNHSGEAIGLPHCAQGFSWGKQSDSTATMTRLPRLFTPPNKLPTGIAVKQACVRELAPQKNRDLVRLSHAIRATRCAPPACKALSRLLDEDSNLNGSAVGCDGARSRTGR